MSGSIEKSNLSLFEFEHALLMPQMRLPVEVIEQAKWLMSRLLYSR